MSLATRGIFDRVKLQNSKLATLNSPLIQLGIILILNYILCEVSHDVAFFKNSSHSL